MGSHVGQGNQTGIDDLGLDDHGGLNLFGDIDPRRYKPERWCRDVGAKFEIQFDFIFIGNGRGYDRPFDLHRQTLHGDLYRSQAVAGHDAAAAGHFLAGTGSDGIVIIPQRLVSKG